MKDGDITAAFEKLSTDLLPPQNMTDAEAMAACGDSVIPYLAKQDRWSASQRAACVRALGLIGGPRAKRCLEGYTHDSANSVRKELGRALENPLQVPGVFAHIEKHGCFPAWVPPSSLIVLRAELVSNVSEDDTGILDHLPELLERAVTREIAVKDRHTLAVALGWLGDPRVTPDLGT